VQRVWHLGHSSKPVVAQEGNTGQASSVSRCDGPTPTERGPYSGSASARTRGETRGIRSGRAFGPHIEVDCTSTNHIRKAARKTTALAAIAIATTLFSGCSASSVINTGGDTKCKDFISHDETKQSDEVSKMVKDKSGADPSPLQITSTRLSATT
jgi:acid stress chaperone HdeA